MAAGNGTRSLALTDDKDCPPIVLAGVELAPGIFGVAGASASRVSRDQMAAAALPGLQRARTHSMAVFEPVCQAHAAVNTPVRELQHEAREVLREGSSLYKICRRRGGQSVVGRRP